MAGVRRADATCFLPSSPNNPFPRPRKPVSILSSISPRFPSKPRRRKNHLRRKLLKTVTSPIIIPNTILKNSEIVFEYPQEQHPEANESEGTHELRVLTSEATAGIVRGEFGKFSKGSVSKWVLYLVGAFIFQKICAVLVSGSIKSAQKDGNLDSGRKTRVSELSMDGNDDAKSGVLLNGSGDSFSGKLRVIQGGHGFVVGPELEEKISEIRAMAREAREKERLESKKALDNDNDDDVKTGIEMEVDSNLVKLRKRLQNSGEKSLMYPVSYFTKGVEVQDIHDEDGLDAKDEVEVQDIHDEDGLDAKDEVEVQDIHDEDGLDAKDEVRSPPGSVRDKPKGFNGSEDHGITRNENSSSVAKKGSITNGSVDSHSVDLLDKGQKLDHPDGSSRGSVSLPLEEESGTKPPKDQPKLFQTTSKKLGNAKAKENSGEGNGVAKSELENGATQENGPGRPLVKGMSSTNSTTGSERAGVKVEDRHSDDKADLWWLSLPYVLVIFCHDVEGSKGLMTLKSVGDTSHTVAFEDQGDAMDFCYLMQSYFEDPGDFNAEIVPLSIKELNEAVNSDNMKVIVVKKGQLKLYAGQPLEEVEMALRSLIK